MHNIFITLLRQSTHQIVSFGWFLHDSISSCFHELPHRLVVTAAHLVEISEK